MNVNNFAVFIGDYFFVSSDCKMRNKKTTKLFEARKRAEICISLANCLISIVGVEISSLFGFAVVRNL
jgi:hypothetical protein